MALPETVGPDKVLIVACVIAAEGTTLDEATLLAFANEHLARYKAPRKIYFMTAFPRTRNGKVLRKQLLLPGATGATTA